MWRRYAGLAYRLPGDWGVLRGAGGVQYGEIYPVTFQQVRFSPPLVHKVVVTAPSLVNPLGALTQYGDVPDPKTNLYLLDPNLRTPYEYQYNASWERRVSGNWNLQLGYVGSRGHKLLTMWYLNRAHPEAGIPLTTATINQRRADPVYAEIRYVLNGSRGYYDAARPPWSSRAGGGFPWTWRTGFPRPWIWGRATPTRHTTPTRALAAARASLKPTRT